jgi:hypothetical protein
VSHHLEPVAGPWDDDVEAFGGKEDGPLRRSAWLRWVAIIVTLAMVIATPFVYVLSRLLS